ncbi:unnamed protein product [Prorocentrum cordatum]|uniref:Uncharacterized protein n=1 Tax=Prorocentrum cordatum TaxID=2364126 RepID=A0ABN9TB98_9DINO|nr:unnamed protein product [Polarella glacialis]
MKSCSFERPARLLLAAAAIAAPRPSLASRLATQSRGVRTKVSSKHFDCSAGLAEAERGWSDEKRRHCCATESRGCERDYEFHIVGTRYAPAPAPAAAPTTSTTTTTPVELPAVSIILEFKHMSYAAVEDSADGEGGAMRREIARVVRDIIGEQCSPDLFDNVIVPNDTNHYAYENKEQHFADLAAPGLLQARASAWRRQSLPAAAAAGATEHEPLPTAPAAAPPLAPVSPAEAPALSPMSSPVSAPAAALAPAMAPATAPPGVVPQATSPESESVPPPPFDCAAGLDKWFVGWSADKMSWCCANEGKGCTATTSSAFDCAAGLANWEAGWSAAKKQWCCSSQSKGCSGEAMNMNASTETNLTNFTNMTWTEAETYVTEPTQWWLNVTGNCTTIGYCVQSPNYPQKYGNDQGCNITLNQSVRPKVTGMMFSSESSYDVLTVNGQEYSGTTGPVGVVPTSTITWSSDHVNQGHGWQLCFQERDIVLTVTTTPKPMVYDGCPVNVFAQFFPGNTEMLKDRPFQRFLKKGEEPFDSFAQVSRGKDESVFLEILVTEKANTRNEELPVAMEIIKRTQGDLFVALKNAMRRFVDFKPIVGGMYLNWVALQPYHVDTCEAKMSKMVHEFSKSYTRRLVPWALYNECTNWMTALSFSHDPLVNELDHSKCRAWTHNFMQKWNYGKGVKEVADPNLFDCQAGLSNWEQGWSSEKKCWCCAHKSQGCDPALTCPQTWAVNRTVHIDYKCWCQGVCESKFGVGAPVCHMTSGAKNFYQPV